MRQSINSKETDMAKLSVKITVTGSSLDDLGFAIDQAKKEILNGFQQGGDKDEGTSYHYDVTSKE